MTNPNYTAYPNGVGTGLNEAVVNTNAATTALQLTLADIQLATGLNAPTAPAAMVFLRLTGTLTGALNATLPTSAPLLAAMGGVPNTYMLRIINASAGAFAWTLVTNTGWTLNGTMTIAQNTWRDFVVTVNADGTGTITSVGTGTYS